MIRAARQALLRAAWQALVALASATFQACLLWAELRCNDALFGLTQRSLIAFCVGLPASLEWSKPHLKQMRAAHFCHHTFDRALHAYARSRLECARSNKHKALVARTTNISLRRQPSDSAAADAPAPPWCIGIIVEGHHWAAAEQDIAQQAW